MRRSSPLTRKTPLRSHSTLSTKQSLQRKSPMSKRRSARARSKEFPAWVRAVVWERADGRCEKCRRRKIMHYHHCIYRSAGGPGTLENCCGLCAGCHTIDDDSAHKSRTTREWCVTHAREQAAIYYAERGQVDAHMTTTENKR